MRSVPLIALCILSFVSVAFSALAFSRRLGPKPAGHEDPAVPAVSPHYTLGGAKNEVLLFLDSDKIKVEGRNFIAKTFGHQKGLLFPGAEAPIQAGDLVVIILLGEGVDANKVVEHVQSIPNTGDLLASKYLRDTCSMFGFMITHGAKPKSVEPKSSHVGKRHGEELVRHAKRQARELVLNCVAIHNLLDRAALSMGGAAALLLSSLQMSPEASAEIEGRSLKLRASSGAMAFVVRKGVVDQESFVSQEYSVPHRRENPDEVMLHIYSGDVVVLLVQTAEHCTLDPLPGLPELVQDIGIGWNWFTDHFCQDQFSVAVFTV